MQMHIEDEDEPMCTCDASVVESVTPSSLPGQSFIPRLILPPPNNVNPYPQHSPNSQQHPSILTPLNINSETKLTSLNSSKHHKSKPQPLQSQNPPVMLDVISFKAKVVIKDCGNKMRVKEEKEVDRRQCVKENGEKTPKKRVHKVIKRYRMSRVRRVKRQEYRKLRDMVPALQVKNKVTKVEVIEEAIKYIDQLHSALVTRFRARGLPTTLNASLSDDGGFMAAMTADAKDRKNKVVRKRKLSDSEGTKDGKPASVLAGAAKSDLPEINEENEASTTSEDPTTTTDEKKDAELVLSPTSIKPTLNFYQETLKDEADPPTPTEEVPSKDSSVEPLTETATTEETGDTTPIDDTETTEAATGDDDKMDVESDDNKEEVESIASPPPLPVVPVIAAPPSEKYEKVEVTFSQPTPTLRSCLNSTTKVKREKKVTWVKDDDLKQVFLFPMDETERVNVNSIKFEDMLSMDRAGEKEMFKQHNLRTGFIAESLRNMTQNDFNQGRMTEFFTWKMFPITMEPSSVVAGYKSKEKHVQADREGKTMAAFFHPNMLPDTPSEPDPEILQRLETRIIPMSDVGGSDQINDHRTVPWPEPVMIHPQEFFGGAVPREPAAPGGHWVVGGGGAVPPPMQQPPQRFGAPPMYGGPNGPPMPGAPPGAYPGPPQQFNGPPGNWGNPLLMPPGAPPMMGPPMGQPGPPPGMMMNMGGANMNMPMGGPRHGHPNRPMDNDDRGRYQHHRGGRNNWDGGRRNDRDRKENRSGRGSRFGPYNHSSRICKYFLAPRGCSNDLCQFKHELPD